MSLPRNQLLATLVITLAVIAALIVLAIRWPFLAGTLFVTLVAFRAVLVARKHGFGSSLSVFLKEVLFGW